MKNKRRGNTCTFLGITLTFTGPVLIIFNLGNYYFGADRRISYTQYGNELIPAEDPYNPKFIVGVILGIILTISGIIIWMIGKRKK
jgi:uncharacterized membrane protein